MAVDDGCLIGFYYRIFEYVCVVERDGSAEMKLLHFFYSLLMTFHFSGNVFEKIEISTSLRSNFVSFESWPHILIVLL